MDYVAPDALFFTFFLKATDLESMDLKDSFRFFLKNHLFKNSCSCALSEIHLKSEHIFPLIVFISFAIKQKIKSCFAIPSHFPHVWL